MIKNYSKIQTKVRAKKDKKILSDLYAKTAEKATLKKQVLDTVPDALKQYIYDCFMHQTILILVVENQLVASKIRYILPQLRVELQRQNEFKMLRKIRLQIKVSHFKEDKDVNTEANSQYSKPQYSSTSSSLLNEFAESIGDQELQGALIKLAKHVKET